MICTSIPNPTYFFFSEGVPSLLYYSHFSAIIVSLIVGVFIFYKSKNSLLGKLLLAMSLTFSLWTLSNLILWTNNSPRTILFVWSLFGLMSAAISVLSIYFFEVFIKQKDVSFRLKVFFLVISIPVIILTPTNFNLSGFNFELCGASGFEGVFFLSYYTALGLLAAVWVLTASVRGLLQKDSLLKKQIVLMGLGMEFFLLSFFTTSFLASYLNDAGVVSDYSLEFYGLFGMVVFLAFIGYMIVKFKMFNLKVIGSNVLILVLWIAIGALLFVDDIDTVHALVGLTMIVAIILGFLLINGVRKEVRHREEIERLNEQLKGLLHFISHEVKGALGKNQNIFSLILDGDYGAITSETKTLIAAGLRDTVKSSEMVMTILLASSFESGALKFNMTPYDFKKSFIDLTDDLRVDAKTKGLDFEIKIHEGGRYIINGDNNLISQHVLRNIIDNSINYTPSGKISVDLTNVNEMVRVSVKDTGVGISEEDKKKLFTQGGRGRNSVKVNVHSTGYGLYFAKGIVDSHGGKIWAESGGSGKGTTFFVEFPTVI